MHFYKNHYEVVIIGGGLAGLSCALHLQKAGMKDILILEKHNLPGGLATSFVRNGVEFEAALHELMGVGTEEEPGEIEQFFREMGIRIEWLSIPDCYRIALPNSGIDVTLPADYEGAAREIDKVCPGTYDKVLKLFSLCRSILESMNALSDGALSKFQMVLRHPEFIRTLGYSSTEVLRSFGLPEKAVEILTPYWLYLGNRMDDLPFSIFAYVLADYFRGSHTCRHTSYEMGSKMAAKAEENGAQIEYRQEVEKILVRDGRIYGVRTARGDEIHCDLVVCGAYPDKAYTQMIEPLSEVPEGAVKLVNGRTLSLCPVSVILLLEGTPEELGIHEYAAFSGDTMDTNQIWENLGNLTEPYDFITTICLNHVNPECCPEGYTELSLTVLPLTDPFMNVREEEYHDLKRRLANEMIEAYLRQTGTPDFRDRIAEFEVETPMTVARYVGAFRGCIYGYLHSLSDHVGARYLSEHGEHFIKGLVFAGAHSPSGDGMGPAIFNGRDAARAVLSERKEVRK